MSWLAGLTAAVVAACAAMAMSGFRGRPDCVGIDLGTTFSVIALRTADGVTVLRDHNNRALVPSIVYFPDNGTVVVGHAAQEYQSVDPAYVIFNAKKFIGRRFEDDVTRAQSRLHPFSIVPNLTESTSGAWFGLAGRGGELAVSPETVGAHILRHLLDIAAYNLGHRQVSKVVMAVPAKFDDSQRRATAAAFKEAGLKIMRVIEEPTAAALAYGLDSKPNVHYILVYDFGGGTLDVSLLFVNKESVQVLATNGDDQLGGSDFDHCVATYLESQISETSGKISKTHGCSGDAMLSCERTNLRIIAEEMKREISLSEETFKSCLLVPSDKCMNLSLSRAQFEHACSGLFQRAISPVDALLEESAMDPEEVDEIVLVGGTSRIPYIRQILRDYFSVDHLNLEIDPDITVAMGAASVVD